MLTDVAKNNNQLHVDYRRQVPVEAVQRENTHPRLITTIHPTIDFLCIHKQLKYIDLQLFSCNCMLLSLVAVYVMLMLRSCITGAVQVRINSKFAGCNV